MMSLEERVKERLDLLGKKKNWLEGALGVAQSTLWRKITGEGKFSYDQMKKLAASLECDLGYLTGESDTPVCSALIEAIPTSKWKYNLNAVAKEVVNVMAKHELRINALNTLFELVQEELNRQQITVVSVTED